MNSKSVSVLNKNLLTQHILPAFLWITLIIIYSRVSNKRAGWNKRVGWKNPPNFGNF